MDILALCDSRELRGVDHVSLGRREKGKHVSGRFENPPLRAIKVRAAREEEKRMKVNCSASALQ
jgi:hypothetical protein